MSKQISFTMPTIVPDGFNWRPLLMVATITLLGPIGVFMTIRFWSIAFISFLLHGFCFAVDIWPAAFLLNFIVASLLAYDLQRNKQQLSNDLIRQADLTEPATEPEIVTPKPRRRPRKGSTAKGLSALMETQFDAQGEGGQ